MGPSDRMGSSKDPKELSGCFNGVDWSSRGGPDARYPKDDVTSNAHISSQNPLTQMRLVAPLCCSEVGGIVDGDDRCKPSRGGKASKEEKKIKRRKKNADGERSVSYQGVEAQSEGTVSRYPY